MHFHQVDQVLMALTGDYGGLISPLCSGEALVMVMMQTSWSLVLSPPALGLKVLSVSGGAPYLHFGDGRDSSVSIRYH